MNDVRENILIYKLLELEDRVGTSLVEARSRSSACHEHGSDAEEWRQRVKNLDDKARDVHAQLIALVGEDDLDRWRQNHAEYEEGRGTDYPSNVSYELAVLQSGAYYFALLKPVFEGFARFLVHALKRAEQDTFSAFVREKLRVATVEAQTPPPLSELPRPPVAPLAPPL
ncbi:hypothetical protein GCM10008959_24270 [Deinococcus seoulensis]|uniref:Uncharacterized protein n=1 Tax=Deinococcus seoulensis TaxID=1837379 RepID=A0ABQ2RS19_9DEIO|nr:hypothetical protein [Deinococcus seoulensis]GGR61542.1 hypothetical protein GCM10008959_24270 [Deinococcus seoulensis]